MLRFPFFFGSGLINFGTYSRLGVSMTSGVGIGAKKGNTPSLGLEPNFC